MQFYKGTNANTKSEVVIKFNEKTGVAVGVNLGANRRDEKGSDKAKLERCKTVEEYLRVRFGLDKKAAVSSIETFTEADKAFTEYLKSQALQFVPETKEEAIESVGKLETLKSGSVTQTRIYGFALTQVKKLASASEESKAKAEAKARIAAEKKIIGDQIKALQAAKKAIA